MMDKINQQFSSFQTVMLQTTKDLIISIVPQITKQQWSVSLSPSPYDIFNTQPPQYLSHGSLLTYPSHPQLPLNQMPQPTLHPTTPPIYTQPQSTQGTTSPSPQTIPPTLPQTQTSKYSTLPPSQTSFENAMTAIDADLWIRSPT